MQKSLLYHYYILMKFQIYVFCFGELAELAEKWRPKARSLETAAVAIERQE